MITVGIDNGSSGSVGILKDGQCIHFGPVPTKDFLHYGKKGTISKRLDRTALLQILETAAGRLFCSSDDTSDIRVYLERPFTGGAMMINSMLSSARFFEATIILMEDLYVGYEVVDSGTWQKPILGDVKGSAELKKASLLRGLQYYPAHTAAIKKQKDADGLLISHFFHHRQQTVT